MTTKLKKKTAARGPAVAERVQAAALDKAVVLPAAARTHKP